MGFLIDTCIWIDVERGFLAPSDIAGITRDEPVYLSPVTIAELKFGAEVAASAGIRQKRLAAIHRLKKKPILRIDGLVKSQNWDGKVGARSPCPYIKCKALHRMVYRARRAKPED
jgi:hypothetical protein